MYRAAAYTINPSRGCRKDDLICEVERLLNFRGSYSLFYCAKRHLGQRYQRMSALLPKADIADQDRDVRFAPKADMRWQIKSFGKGPQW